MIKKEIEKLNYGHKWKSIGNGYFSFMNFYLSNIPTEHMLPFNQEKKEMQKIGTLAWGVFLLRLCRLFGNKEPLDIMRSVINTVSLLTDSLLPLAGYIFILICHLWVTSGRYHDSGMLWLLRNC